MSPVALRLDGIGKRYRIGQRERYRALRDTLTDALTAPVRVLGARLRPGAGPPPIGDDHIWALREVSFEVAQGDVVGIIGGNGAGKSTLLKILSRITAPTTGRAEIHGRVGSLLEVGTGFHPELTGRENIYLNGAILGMRTREIERKFDEIVAFAEVEKFLDTPVKRYSSGMYLRLGFAVAAHLEPEILLVDEVLAVGDAAFQRKCLGKMGDVARGGRTVLFVSHNMASVARLCTRALRLSAGAATYFPDVQGAINEYLGSGAAAGRGHVDLRRAPGWDRERRVILTSVTTHRGDGAALSEFETGQTLAVRIGYQLDEPLAAYCQVNVLNALGERVMTLRSTHQGSALKLDGTGFVDCVIPDLRLVSGVYTVMLEIGREFPHTEWLDCVPEAAQISVSLGSYLGGADLLPGQGPVAQRSHWAAVE